jgi:hypothetical protein
MCGGIHSSVSKATRRIFKEEDVDAESPIAVVGDKSKSQLSRTLSKNLFMTFNQIGRDVPTFADAAGVADLIIKSGVEYDSVVIVYNKFVSALSYESAVVEVETAEALKESCMSRFHSYQFVRLIKALQLASRPMRWRMTLPRTSLSSLSLMPSTPLWLRVTLARFPLGKCNYLRFYALVLMIG